MLNPTGCFCDEVPDEVLENVLYFHQRVAEYRNTFGIPRVTAPVDAMRVCRKWFRVITMNPRFWTDVFLQDDVNVSIMKLQLQRTGQCLPLRLWLTSGAVAQTTTLDAILPYAKRLDGIFLEPLQLNLSPTFASPVRLNDMEKWIGMPLPNLRDLHLGAFTINEHPPTVRASLPKLENLSFGLTVPRFVFPQSGLRYLGFFSSLVTMRKLSEYMTHCQETLKTLNLEQVTMTDVDAPEGAFPHLVMPHVTEVVIKAPGGNSLAELLLTNVHYPKLCSLTFSASPGRRFGSWDEPAARDIHLPDLQILDFGGGIMPIGAFRDLLNSAPSVRKLVMPGFASEEQLGAAVNVLVAWSNRQGNGLKSLEELVTADLDTKDLVKLVQALPSVRTLDVSRVSKTQKAARDSEEGRWLREHVDNLVGLDE
ncbi:hypothetical protein FS837_006693 [Tulasnella sp. UAMH 9824]|nr:hypothetical protein FS837_006693 [Tulasnella sp. UAMH 9824]